MRINRNKCAFLCLLAAFYFFFLLHSFVLFVFAFIQNVWRYKWIYRSSLDFIFIWSFFFFWFVLNFVQPYWLLFIFLYATLSFIVELAKLHFSLWNVSMNGQLNRMFLNTKYAWLFHFDILFFVKEKLVEICVCVCEYACITFIIYALSYGPEAEETLTVLLSIFQYLASLYYASLNVLRTPTVLTTVHSKSLSSLSLSRSLSIPLLSFFLFFSFILYECLCVSIRNWKIHCNCVILRLFIFFSFFSFFKW